MTKHTNAVERLEKDLWEREYGTLKVIPSSTRTLPSKALVLFSEILDFKNLRRVLDVGCGIGRNSVYLAKKGCQVHAVDFSETALNQLNAAATREGLRSKIHICYCLLQSTFPYRDRAFDLVVDSYVFCHFTDDRVKEHYRSELCRVTKPGGLVFSSVFSVRDAYYREMIGHTHSDEGPRVIVDPHNGIKKRLYTEDEIKAFFQRAFDVMYFVTLEFKDVVLGSPYWRSIFVLILKRNL